MYANRPDPSNSCLLPSVNTSGPLYPHFIFLLFLDAHRETSALVNELTEESDQFRFICAGCSANLQRYLHSLKASVGDLQGRLWVIFRKGGKKKDLQQRCSA
jgi:hypothetical protein